MVTIPPALVMIIRHGEKPGDPANDDDGGPHLAPLGSGRSAGLPSLFTPDPNAQMPVANWEHLSCDVAIGTKNQFTGTYVSSGINAGQSRFPTPDFLFATQQDPPNTGSNRPAKRSLHWPRRCSLITTRTSRLIRTSQTTPTTTSTVSPL